MLLLLPPPITFSGAAQQFASEFGLIPTFSYPYEAASAFYQPISPYLLQPLLQANYYCYAHSIGRAVLHSGAQTHRSRAVTSGVRVNVVVWMDVTYRFQRFGYLLMCFEMKFE